LNLASAVPDLEQLAEESEIYANRKLASIEACPTCCVP